jgi:predicted DNA-binding transcriptional regulator AlpA
MFSTVVGVEPEPVGLAEIAERLGVKRATADMWKLRGLLPEPRWKVGGRPAWDWADIAAWAAETGRAT